MTKSLISVLILVLMLGIPSVGAYHSNVVEAQSTDTATNTTTTPQNDDPILNNVSSTDSGVGGSTSGNEVESNFGIVGGDDKTTTTETSGSVDKSTPKLQELTGSGANYPDSDAEPDVVATTTSTEAQYNESDLNFVNRLIELGAIYINFSDIKGESGEGTTDGDPDKPLVTGRVYNDGKGGSGVIIKGKKILENDEIPALLKAAPDAEDVDTNVELALYGARVASDNEGFSEIRMNNSRVEIDYRHGLKLLSFIKSTIPATVTITFSAGEPGMTADEFGRVKVQFPWWHIFGRKTVRPTDISSAYEGAIGDGLNLENVSARNARVLQTLSGIMKNIHDSGVTIVGA